MKKSVSNAMLVLICAMIILYTIANFVLQYFVQVEVSPTLTTAWFAFWGTELVALAAIKTCKVKNEKKSDQAAAPTQNVQDVQSAPIGNPEQNGATVYATVADKDYYSIDIEGVK
jgi:hypothetical protein